MDIDSKLYTFIDLTLANDNAAMQQKRLVLNATEKGSVSIAN